MGKSPAKNDKLSMMEHCCQGKGWLSFLCKQESSEKELDSASSAE